MKEHQGKYQLIRNGQAFYIKGGAAAPGYLKQLKEAGANTARIYDTTSLQKVLDEAHSLGLAVAVDLPMPRFSTDPQFYEDPVLFREMKINILRTVEQYKHHPALLYWNLGNEIYYPYAYKNTVFFKRYNSLIDLLHQYDPNHPVSTTTIGANKLRVLSIITRSPQLDFISFNSFGTLSTFQDRLRPIAPVWNGPYVISEWGVNGPWEAQNTAWNVPIEETSTKKAEQIFQRHQDYLVPLRDQNSLGSFVFYWGQKNEFTPTWYSLFRQQQKSQAVFELSRIWKDQQEIAFPGPEMEYILLNGRGAPEDIVLAPGETAEVSVILPQGTKQHLSYEWEVREESWADSHKSQLARGVVFQKDGSTAKFRVPRGEGPYRVHLYLTNGTGYFATANIPFYVLTPSDE